MESPEPSLFTVLVVVEKRPSMYLGFDDQNRGKQLHALEAFIAGYFSALHQHRLHDRGFDTYARFPDYLRARFGWSVSRGPIAAIREHSSSDAAAWEQFWTLLRDFQSAAGGEER